MGAARPQAAILAAQLLKRAGQLAIERGISREAALANLVKVVIQGRSGETPSLDAQSPPEREEK
ncbi:MAG: hypothetical protein ABIO94_12490, partial [Opitutaceae bacterium]